LWIKKADGKIRLIFSSSSESELTGWVLSFADEAKVVKPKWLVEKSKSDHQEDGKGIHDFFSDELVPEAHRHWTPIWALL